MQFNFQRIKNAGLILFIFIICVMQLSGVMADGNDEEPAPEPTTSSAVNETPPHQVADPSDTNQLVQETSAAAVLYFPIVVQPENTDADDEGDDVPFMNEFEQAVLDLVNIERQQAGCGPVEGEYYLRTAAFLHSKDMADNAYFSHTGLNGSRFWERASDAGYQGFAAGENIAAGYRSPESVMNGWMNSSGHRANILNCSHTHLGVGYYYGNGTPYGAYWTQVFGRQ